MGLDWVGRRGWAWVMRCGQVRVGGGAAGEERRGSEWRGSVRGGVVWPARRGGLGVEGRARHGW